MEFSSQQILLSRKSLKSFLFHKVCYSEDGNPFHVTNLFWDPLKTLEMFRFSDVFRDCRKRPVTWDGLKKVPCLCITFINHKLNPLPHKKEKIVLPLSWRKFPSYRNQSIDFQNTFMYWFLYNRHFRHERIIEKTTLLHSWNFNW